MKIKKQVEVFKIKIFELIDMLKKNEFNVSNIELTDYYKKNKENEVKLGIYARLSKKEDKIIRRQLLSLKRYAIDVLGLKHNEIYEFCDNGFSGTMTNRPEYRKMLRDIKLDKINVIMTTHIDRFGRAIEQVISTLYPNGTVENLYISLDNMLINAPENMRIIKEESIKADNYASTSSIKSKRGLRTSMASGSVINSKTLYGYEIIMDESTGIRKFVLGDDIKVQTVKDIYNLYLTGKTMTEISKILSYKKIHTPSGNNKWAKSTIEFILKNPLYTGELLQGRYEKLNYTYSGEGAEVKKTDRSKWIYGGTFEGIIDKKIYQIIQSMLDENKSIKHTSEKRKLFTGILKCGDCCRALVYKEKAKGYKCSGSQKKEYGCSTHLVKEDELYEIIKPKIISKIINNKGDIFKGITGRVKKDIVVSHKQNRISKIADDIDKAVKKLADLYIEKDEIKYSEMVINEIENRIKNLKNEEELLRNEIGSEIELEEKMIRLLDNVGDIIKPENWIIKLFIKRINIYDDGKIEIEWRC